MRLLVQVAHFSLVVKVIMGKIRILVPLLPQVVAVVGREAHRPCMALQALLLQTVQASRARREVRREGVGAGGH